MCPQDLDVQLTLPSMLHVRANNTTCQSFNEKMIYLKKKKIAVEFSRITFGDLINSYINFHRESKPKLRYFLLFFVGVLSIFITNCYQFNKEYETLYKLTTKKKNW